ncbi:endo-1,4-beta-xylanase [Parapedobacter composti]|uniref:Beta-xylanase n=1 Tax=Parapedobacter composti TaxID=623281 RepID=A0A1I1J0Q5_9SPHI|nr:endo-1,4-beta-xylanase [Parapedobacter composti]SFC39503.1 endo-1,4-beta-xylanase [Parapedobacter composti]
MNKRLFLLSMRACTLLLLMMAQAACSDKGDGPRPDTEPPEEQPGPSILKEKANFGIGAAIKTAHLAELAYANTVKSHFSQVTAEWEMKMELIWSSATGYNWSNADRVVDFAKDNDLEVHGHTLVWYKSFPGWFKNAGYDSTAFEDRVRAYIQTTVGRYKGRVKSWDVANEIFNDNGTLRSTDCPVFATFNDPIGFYGRCFKYAHEADPDAKLFYNDYSVVLASAKRSAIKRMVSRFKNEGIPIHGIGDQFHYRVTTDKNTIKNGLTDMASTGLLIHLSELDIIVNVQQSESYAFTQAEAQKQADMYRFIVESYESLPADQKFAITTWGVTDKYTWLTDYWHAKEYPLLFDQHYQEKEAYRGFLAGLKNN